MESRLPCKVRTCAIIKRTLKKLKHVDESNKVWNS